MKTISVNWGEKVFLGQKKHVMEQGQCDRDFSLFFFFLYQIFSLSFRFLFNPDRRLQERFWLLDN